MAKQPKPKLPTKKRMAKFADDLWALAVKHDWADKCAVCGHRGGLNSHHLIPRTHIKTRYDLRNGICLCTRCHIWNDDVSPHQNAAGFILWLNHHQPAAHTWLLETLARGSHKKFDAIKNASYYCETIKGLKECVDDEDYVRIVGQKFSVWLDEN